MTVWLKPRNTVAKCPCRCGCVGGIYIFENLTNGYGAGTTELHILRPFGKNIFAQYLLAYVKSDYFVENGKQTFTGDVGQQRISKVYVENAYFPLPPNKEQERIVQQIGIIFEYLNMITNALY